MKQARIGKKLWLSVAIGMGASAPGYPEGAYLSKETDLEVPVLSVRIYETTAMYELGDDDDFWVKSKWRLSISPSEYRNAMVDLRIVGGPGAVYTPRKFVVTGLSEDGKTASAAYPTILGTWGDHLAAQPRLVPVPQQNVIIAYVESDVAYGNSKISLTATWEDENRTAWIEIEERGLFYVDLREATGLIGSMAGFFKVPFVGWFAQSIASEYARETMAEYHNDFFEPARALAELVEQNRRNGVGR